MSLYSARVDSHLFNTCSIDKWIRLMVVEHAVLAVLTSGVLPGADGRAQGAQGSSIQCSVHKTSLTEDVYAAVLPGVRAGHERTDESQRPSRPQRRPCHGWV